MGHIHAANIKTSDRLQRLLYLLRTHVLEGVTSLEITEALGILNPGTEVSALRHNGYDVECKYDGKTSTGAKRYRYFLLRGGQKNLF